MNGVQSVGRSAGASVAIDSGGSKFHVGQKIDGVVLEVREDGLATIGFGGRTLTAASKGGLMVGEAVRLLITDTQGGHVYATRIRAEETAVLHRLGVAISDQSIDLVAQLMSGNHPVDKELLGRLLKNGQEVKILASELARGAELPPDSFGLDAPLKDLLVAMFKSQGEQVRSGASVPAAVAELTGGAAPGTGAVSETGAAAADASGSGILAEAMDAEAVAKESAQAAAQGVGADALDSAGQATKRAAEKMTSDPASAEDGRMELSSSDAASGAGGSGAALRDTAATGAAPRGGVAADASTADGMPLRGELSAEREAGREVRGAEAAMEPRREPGAEAAKKTQGAAADKDSKMADGAKASGESGAEGGGVAADSRKEAALLLLRAASNPGSVSKADLHAAARVVLAHFSPKENVQLVIHSKQNTLEQIARAMLQPSDLADEFVQLAKSVLTENVRDFAAAIQAAKRGEAPLFENAVQNERLQLIQEAVKSMPKQENQQIYYMPVPIRIEGHEQRADLYYKRPQKKREDISILVALHTERLGEVRCLVNRFQKDYILGFALESESVSAVFRENIDALKRALGHISLPGRMEILIRKREEVDQEFFEAEVRHSDFDVRV